MPELRIALLTHSVNPRGGVVHTLELARALHDLGHRVTVFAPAQPGQAFFRPVRHAVSLVPVGPAPAGLAEMVGDRIAAVEAHLGTVLREQPFDIFHAHDGIGGNALANLVARGAIPGFVRTVHHLDDFADPRVAAWQRCSVRQAQQVLCVSSTWCERIRRDFGITAALVGNGVDRERYTRHPDRRDAALAARLGLRPGSPLLLSVGGVEARKNTQRTLQAFLQLRATHPHAQWVVAGGASLLDHSSYAREFHARVAASGLATGIGSDLVLAGPLPDDEMPALFRLADVLAMPSLKEGFGLVVLEALASGTPVVVSRIAPFTEYLGDTVACGHAVYADPDDPASIAHALRRAVEPQRADALARTTPMVCRRYSWPASAARHAAIYRTLTAAVPA